MHRHDEIRRQNDRIAAGARVHHFEDSRVPFLCECDNGACREFISLHLPSFDAVREMRLFLVLPGHRLATGRCVMHEDGYEGHSPDLSEAAHA